MDDAVRLDVGRWDGVGCGDLGNKVRAKAVGRHIEIDVHRGGGREAGGLAVPAADAVLKPQRTTPAALVSGRKCTCGYSTLPSLMSWSTWKIDLHLLQHGR